MAFIDFRKSRGQKYWSIVESRRVSGKPRNFILEYLGTADTLLKRLKKQEEIKIKSYTHGDTISLINEAKELGIIDIINKHVKINKNGEKQKRNSLTVGASILLAALGRACQPTSKMGWYNWCSDTSLEYSLKSSFKKLDSGHFWDQMDSIAVETIPLIEEEIVKRLVETHKLKPDCLLLDTSNFFTFIDSANKHCEIPKRGKNKQRRCDLRQIGLGFLVTRKDQFPLFHKTYEGNKNDITFFKETFHSLMQRLRAVSFEISDVTLIFDKGNNSKENFKMLDEQKEFHYVAGLVSAYFKNLIKKANENFEPVKIDNESIPAYRTKQHIWGEERTCIITISNQLKEGQLRGIYQHLGTKYKKLQVLKQQLENLHKRKKLSAAELKERLTKIIRGQFVEDILKYDLIRLNAKDYSFTYYIDQEAFDYLTEHVLGRRILITNRHNWTSEEIILAYRGQAKVEYAFRNLKNPYHTAIRPQYHWTDQKIQIHILICIIGYLLTICSYSRVKEKAGYQKNLHNFMQDLAKIRLAVSIKKNGKNKKAVYQLEEIPKELKKLASVLNINNSNLRPKLNLSCYN